MPLSANGYTMTIGPGTGGTLTLNDIGVAMNTANGSSSTVNLSMPITIGSSGNWSISGQVSGADKLTKVNFGGAVTANGTGTTLTLGGPANNAPGLYTFNSTVALNNLTRGGWANATFNGQATITGNLTISGAGTTLFAANSNSITGNIAFTVDSTTLTFSGNNNTIGGTLLSNHNSNTITFSGSGNTFTGQVSNTGGGNTTMLFNGPNNTFTAGSIVMSGGTLGVGAQDGWGSATTINYTAGTLALTGNHTINNPITVNGNITFAPNSGVVTYAGALSSFTAAKGLTVNGSSGVLRFHPSSGTAANNVSVTGGVLAVSPTWTLPTGNWNINGASAVLLLEDTTWSAWNTLLGYGAGAGQWRLTAGGLAARGSAPLAINTLPAGLSLIGKVLGSAIRDSSGAFYANQPIDVQVGTAVTGRDTITLASTGAGLTGNPAGAVVQRISGNITGAGAPQFVSAPAATASQIGEVALSGTGNAWSGSSFVSGGGGLKINTGQGGMLANDVLVRFASPDALPNGGTAGSLRWLVAVGSSGAAGYILTGSPTGVTYDLGATRSGYRFMAATTGRETLGVDGGTTTLRNSYVQIDSFNSGGDNGGPGINLFVPAGSRFNLGDATAPVTFVTSYGGDAADSGLTGAATWSALASGVSGKVIAKRGEGTLYVQNINYQKIDGSAAPAFTWYTGRAVTGNSGANAYFDGAVRETGTGATNSLSGQALYLTGGVLETSGTFSRALNNASGNNFTWEYGGGGGFSAGGGNLDVDISGVSQIIWGVTSRVLAANDSLIFGSNTADARVNFIDHLWLDATTNVTSGTREIRVIDNTSTTADFARISGAIDGTSYTALNKTGTGTLDLAASNFYAGGTNVNAGTLLANGAAVITQTKTGTRNTSNETIAGIDTTGLVVGQSVSGTGIGANTLIVAVGANTITVSVRPTSAGTSSLTFGAGSATGTGPVQVNSGATLGGTGTVAGATTVAAGGILAPGNSPGTLTLGGGLLLNNASLLNFELGPSGTPGGGVNDLVEVTGNFTLDGILNVTQLAGFGPQPLGAPGIYRLFDYTGSFLDNGLQVSSFGPNTSGWVTTIDLTTAGQVNLIVIPEPATLGLLALGGLLALSRRSRRA